MLTEILFILNFVKVQGQQKIITYFKYAHWLVN